MAIEQINVSRSGIIRFTDRDRSGFTADVSLSFDELRQILKAVEDSTIGEADSAWKKTATPVKPSRFEDNGFTLPLTGTAADRIAANRPTCEFCDLQHGTDADCDPAAEEAVRRRIDREDAAARRREMRDDMQNSRAALQSILR